MNPNKKLYLVIAILASLNIGLSIMLFIGGRPHKTPKDKIIQKLDFDDKQIAEYEELIKKHREVIGHIDAEILAVKTELLTSLAEEESYELNNQLIEQIGKDIAKIEAAHLRHFKEIKAICRVDQLEKFQKLTKELARIFSKPPPPKH